MGVFDQAARWAANADPAAVLSRLLRHEGRPFTILEWFDTRTVSMPGGIERAADLIPVIDNRVKPEVPWLIVTEFQAQHDEAKLDTTLLEAATLRVAARHGPEKEGRYFAVAAFVYLAQPCPASLLDMTLPSGAGTRHQALVWDVCAELAGPAIEKAARGEWSWGTLFWVPLMAGAGDATVIKRWVEVAEQVVKDEARRGQLFKIALVFAELSRRVPEWRRGMATFTLTESQVVNEWKQEAWDEATLRTSRKNLLALIDGRFPGRLQADYRRMIDQQDSLPMLDLWFSVAAAADSTFDAVLAALRR
ncbi:MAG: hypothetical protein K2W96_15830 [Gemmataceae bacterium]|nr:hypothetical protein [Gemmataceae bacterium]